MNKTTKLTITIFTLALLLISGCATQTTQTATQSRENTQDKMLTDKLPIRIGLILPLTGPSADFGNLFKESAVAAAEDLNNGGKLNRRVELVFEDTGGDPKNAVTAMQKMINVEGIKLFSSITSRTRWRSSQLRSRTTSYCSIAQPIQRSTPERR